MENDLIRRALAAYFRGGGTDQPASYPESGVRRHDGRDYVVLRNARGVLAVYRVRTSGVLKGLRRWPAALGAPPTP